MADEVTATRGSDMADEKTDNRDAINEKLNEVRDLLIEDGADENTADALVNFARPSTGGTVVGNLADLQRMGAIVVEGKLPKNSMPANQEQDEVETSNLEDAFAEPPVQPTDDELAVQSGSSPVNRRTDEEEAARSGETSQSNDSTTAASDSSTKAELLEQARAKGVTADESMTKAEIVEAINNA